MAGIHFTLSPVMNREDWRGGDSLFTSVPIARHASCDYVVSLVEVWVILDRPPNDPLLRKEEISTSSKKAARGKAAFAG
jgi:hypothetical protein